MKYTQTHQWKHDDVDKIIDLEALFNVIKGITIEQQLFIPLSLKLKMLGLRLTVCLRQQICTKATNL